MCNTHCYEVGRDADLQELSQRGEVTFGGIVTAVTERFSQKTGKPYGFITIEDFEGAGEIALFGDDWTRWSSQMKENYTVYVTAKCMHRFDHSVRMELKIQSVEQMYDVKERKLEKLTLTLDADGIDEEMVSEMAAMIDQYPGETQLLIQLKMAGEQNPVTLTSRDKRVDVNRQLLTYIKSNENIEYKIN